MKIGIIHPIMDVIGGAEQTTISLLNALNDTKHDVTFYTTTKDLTISNGIKTVFVKRLNLPLGWKIQRILEIKKLFEKAKGEDLIIVTSGTLSLAETKKPVIIYCHSTFESELNLLKIKYFGIQKLYNIIIKRKILDQMRLLKKSSVSLIANSEYTKKKIMENLGKDSVVIYPPVKLMEKNPNNIEKSGVITIARYSSEKNLEFAVNTMKKVNTHYRIFGNAKFRLQFELYDNLLNLVKNTHVKLYCNTDKENIEKSLHTSKVYFQTSKETFGISVVEGIIAGCIPIVPDNSANKETVPFIELRYIENDEKDAMNKIKLALKGEYDIFLKKLQEHVNKFSHKKFQDSMLEYISETGSNAK